MSCLIKRSIHTTFRAVANSAAEIVKIVIRKRHEIPKYNILADCMEAKQEGGEERVRPEMN